ncbi:MAG: nitric-oxide reductase large subunit, partial [bacterium]|nr:nitric-oxide reductase large subunit [bacterium]
MQGLKRGAIASFIIAMSILLIGGYFAIDKVPPYPEQVSYDGNILFTKDDIIAGQKVYQRYGLMDHGSIWGHGGLRGVDFSAETLHQIGVHMRDFYAQEKGSTYSALSSEDKALIDARVIDEIKTNNYNESNKTLTVTEAHTYAFGEISEYWNKIFRDGDSGSGFLENTIADQQQRDDISKFFIWTAWSASADRPGEDYSYTNDWPPDRSVGNDVSSDAFIWSIVSILALFVILGLIIYIVHRYKFFYGEAKGIAIADELTKLPLTNSQFKAAKFFLVVSLLFILQTCMGGLLAHYTVHPGTFFLSSIASFIPYSWAKTWHLQLAIFWIATSWVASAIYLAPLISNREPKGQGLLVNLLFGAILI